MTQTEGKPVDTQKPARLNNFDLVRLFAALEVMINHALSHFGYGIPALLAFSPGVTIFYTISGFLIFWSFSERQDLRTYAGSRALRIYPALWACFAFTVAVLTVLGFLNAETITRRAVALWVVTQISFLPIVIPREFAGFGTGNPNGSLWTIAVELQFYLALPLLFYVLNEKARVVQNLILAGLAFLSWYAGNLSRSMNPDSIGYTIYMASVIPYLHFFVYGIALYVNFDTIKPFVVGKAMLWVAAYAAFVGVFHFRFHWYSADYFPNPFSVIGMVLLSIVVVSCAYTLPQLATVLLRHNDISYGLYLYHMVVVNILVTVGLKGWKAVLLCWVTSTLLALGSWFAVERPSMGLKRRLLSRTEVRREPRADLC